MSLLRTAARASVAARVIGNTQRRQQKRWAAAEDAAAAANHQPPAAAQVVPPAVQAPAPAPATSGVDPIIAQLQQLAQLRDTGVLTPTEFEQQKQRILTGA